jgi:hypothetical protein
MSTYREVLLKTKNNQQVIPFILKDKAPVKDSSNPITSGAVESLRTKYLTLSVPDIDKSLHLNIRYTDGYSSVSAATDIIDTLSADSATKVALFSDTDWVNVTTDGIPHNYANKRIIVDLSNLDSTYVIYYSWYYLNIETLEKVYVEPWVSTRLTATASVPKHSELQDRNIANAHTIDSITGLREALANTAKNDYQEVAIKTDAEMADVVVSPGKIITFVGYSTGEVTGAVVMRFKDGEGNFGTLAPGLSANLSNGNLTIEHSKNSSGIVYMSNVSVDEENETLIVE